MRTTGWIGWVAAALVAVWFAGTAWPDSPGSPWMGVIVDDAVDGGVLLVAVHPAGPADRAGLRGGDVLLRVEGRELASQEAFVRDLRSRKPGERLRLELLREGDRLEREVEIGSREESLAPVVFLQASPAPTAVLATPPAPPLLEVYGLRVVDVTPDLRTHFGAPEGSGVLVTRVVPGAPAAVAGLRVGDVLVALGHEPVRSSRDVETLLVTRGAPQEREDPDLVATVIRGHARHVIDVGLPPAAADGRARAAALRGAALEEELHRLRAEASRLARRIDAIERALDAVREGTVREDKDDDAAPPSP